MESDPYLDALFESGQESDLPELLRRMGRDLNDFERYISEQGLDRNDCDSETREAIDKIRNAFNEYKSQKSAQEPLIVTWQGDKTALSELREAIEGSEKYRLSIEEHFDKSANKTVMQMYPSIGGVLLSATLIADLVHRMLRVLKDREEGEIKIELKGKSATIDLSARPVTDNPELALKELEKEAREKLNL